MQSYHSRRNSPEILERAIMLQCIAGITGSFEKEYARMCDAIAALETPRWNAMKKVTEKLYDVMMLG
eukprot:2746133-Amphidinium_carterae.1